MQSVKVLYGRKIKKWTSGEHTITLLLPSGARSTGVENYLEGEYFGQGGTIVSLTASGIHSSSFVTKPNILQIQVFSCDAIKSSFFEDLPAIEQEHNLSSLNIKSPSFVGNPVLTQVQAIINFVATSIHSSSKVNKGVLTQIHVMSADGISSASSIQKPTIHIINNIISNAIKAVPYVTESSIIQKHTLNSYDIFSASFVGMPSLTSGPAYSFGYLLIDGTWYKSTECYICINNTWYGVTSIYETIGDVWNAVVQ